VGRKRDHNEDAYLVDTPLGLFVVADGMGGHLGGDRASRLAVEVVRREISTHTGALDPAEWAKQRTMPIPVLPAEPPDRESAVPQPISEERTSPVSSGSAPVPTMLRQATRSASTAIFEVAQTDALLAGMGTTLTTLYVARDMATLAHVGDSRVYRFR